MKKNLTTKGKWKALKAFKRLKKDCMEKKDCMGGTHVNPWLIHVNVWQKQLQYCKVISLQLIKINEKKKKRLHRDLET